MRQIGSSLEEHLDFTAVEPELHRENEKQQYRISAEMIFQII